MCRCWGLGWRGARIRALDSAQQLAARVELRVWRRKERPTPVSRRALRGHSLMRITEAHVWSWGARVRGGKAGRNDAAFCKPCLCAPLYSLLRNPSNHNTDTRAATFEHLIHPSQRTASSKQQHGPKRASLISICTQSSSVSHICSCSTANYYSHLRTCVQPTSAAVWRVLCEARPPSIRATLAAPTQM
jgi:hypothetical protein